MARLIVNGQDRRYVFYHKPGAVEDQVFYRYRPCAVSAPFSECDWTAETLLPTASIRTPPSSARFLDRIWTCGRAGASDSISCVRIKSDGSQDTVTVPGTAQTDRRVSVVEYNGKLYVFWKHAGAGTGPQPIKWNSYSSTGTWSGVQDAPFSSEWGPAAASGTMELNGNQGNGLWVVYVGDVGGTPAILYRSYSPTTGWYADDLQAWNVDDPVAPIPVEEVTAAMHRGRLHVASRGLDPSQMYYFSCGLPRPPDPPGPLCVGAQTWTRYVQQDPGSSGWVHLDASLQDGYPSDEQSLTLWHRWGAPPGYSGNLLWYRKKRSE
jgi:hypothetical protein